MKLYKILVKEKFKIIKFKIYLNMFHRGYLILFPLINLQETLLIKKNKYYHNIKNYKI